MGSGSVVVLDRVAARYFPISDYAAIGDGRTAALVSREGSIDWWCPARFDSPSVFAALLDAREGGRFSIAPTAQASSVSRYVPDTNVLDTIHTTNEGAVRVVDLAPGHELTGVDNAVIVRRISGLWGEVELEVVLAPRFQYATKMPRFYTAPHGLIARGNGEMLLLSGVDLPVKESGARVGRVVVREGERIDVVLRYREVAGPVPFRHKLARSPAELEASVIERDRAFASATRFEGRDAPLVRRAALALRLLQHAPTGAFVAAATSSLPESVGGVRNWDYRFAWVRDGALAARALGAVGHTSEEGAFRTWLSRTIPDAEQMRIMYTVTGSTELPERVLPHLEGYRRSTPVRVGNEAVEQRQLDVYGELVEFLHATSETPGLDEAAWSIVRSTAEWMVRHWREPDSGIWEMRSAPRHFVLSKVMAWVALTHASQAAEARGEFERAALWRKEALVVREDVLENGVDPETGAFMQAYGVRIPDASNLLIPMVGFMDANDARMVATVDETMRQLTVDGLVYRYVEAHDGLPGTEATFTYCTFWLVEVLATQGRVEEARRLFDALAARATPVGLYAEEMEPFTGEHLGNFPQAFPHAGLIQAAIALEAAEAAARREAFASTA